MVYIWEQPDWPKLTWQDASTAAPLAAVRHDQGRLIGRMEALGWVREGLIAGGMLREVEVTEAMPKTTPWERP